MDQSFIDRIDAQGGEVPMSLAEASIALGAGEALHRAFRPGIMGDYVIFLDVMASEGARLTQLFDEGEVRAIAVWRTYLTTYSGRRFEVDDLVTAEGYRSRGYGATLMRALEERARALSCDAFTLTSATKRMDAHRFYFRERFAIHAFLFAKPVR